MDSLDAECLLMTTEGGCLPTLWCHRDDGSLACRFAGSENELAWPAAAVGEMAARWRAEPGPDLPPPLARIVAAHRTFASLIAEAELDPPDAVFHDLEAAEVRARWSERKVEVIVEAFDRPDEPDERDDAIDRPGHLPSVHLDADLCAS